MSEEKEIMNEKYERIVFCDFDGTITVEETFAGMLKHFAQDRYGEIKQSIIARKLSIREGLRQLVESIPSRHYPQLLEYIRDKEIRPGLVELLDLLRTNGIPFVVISGGLLGLVLARLEPLMEHVHAVYAADVDTTGEYLKIISEFEGESELVAKVKVMSLYGFDESIAIGDGISDLNMALHSSIIFARDPLRKYLDQKKKPYRNWNDFFDICDFLEKHRPCCKT